MVERESLADSIRRKVAERQVDALKAISDCETTEVSASHARVKSIATAAAIQQHTMNPLLPVCIALAMMVIILLTLVVSRGLQ